MTKHIAVLMGGWSAEREVSLSSGAAVTDALKSLGYKVTPLDVGHDVAARLAEIKPDIAFNALHGRYGEDGCIQGVLEVLQIPYTHSGLLASAVAMDKPMAKHICTAADIPCSVGEVMHKHRLFEGEPMPRPYVVKPINEGSSVGVTIVMERDNFNFDENSWPYGDEVLVEKYIPGREIQVAVLDDEALGAIEIRPKGKFYDYEAKYTGGKADHLMPAPLPPKAYAEVCDLAARAHRALGCRGLSRSDFRYDDTVPGKEKFFFLETNTQPGMTPLSLAPEIAAHKGMTFADLVDALVRSARLGN